MYSTGCPSSSRSYSAVCPHLEVSSGSCSGLTLKLLCPTPGTRGSSFLRSMEQSYSFLAVLPQARPVHSRSTLWNGLPLAQRLLPRILSDTFYSRITLLFSHFKVGSASE